MELFYSLVPIRSHKELVKPSLYSHRLYRVKGYSYSTVELYDAFAQRTVLIFPEPIISLLQDNYTAEEHLVLLETGVIALVGEGSSGAVKRLPFHSAFHKVSYENEDVLGLTETGKLWYYPFSKRQLFIEGYAIEDWDYCTHSLPFVKLEKGHVAQRALSSSGVLYQIEPSEVVVDYSKDWHVVQTTSPVKELIMDESAHYIVMENGTVYYPQAEERGRLPPSLSSMNRLLLPPVESITLSYPYDLAVSKEGRLYAHSTFRGNFYCLEEWAYLPTPTQVAEASIVGKFQGSKDHYTLYYLSREGELCYYPLEKTYKKLGEHLQGKWIRSSLPSKHRVKRRRTKSCSEELLY